MGLPSPQTSGSKKQSQPSVELANQRNETLSAPAPSKSIIKVEYNKSFYLFIFFFLLINQLCNMHVVIYCMAEREQSQGYNFKF